ncbi:YpbF [Bacillus freudenreichii]|nr:YpbF [Bacillus freudenreichii]
MEKIMLTLDDQVDEATKKMIQKLIEKKIKFDHYKNTHFFILSFFILYCLTLLFLSYTLVIKPNEYSIMNSITELLGTNYLIFLLLLGVLLFGALKFYFEKKEKTEAEFHDLRCEIIEKSRDLWNGEHWANRHHVFDQMKNQYDINLYHESK